MCLLAALAFPWVSALLTVPAGAVESLEELLAKMDRAAALFRATSADVRWVTHTAVIDDDSIENGTVFLKRTAHEMRMRAEFSEPNQKSVAIHDSKAEIYYPKTQQVDEYDMGSYRDLVEQFYLIGFGTSGMEIAAAYRLKVIGGEEIAKQKTTRLELVPKSAEVLRHMKKLELWLSDAEAYPVQQKFYLAAGDYRLVTYTNVKVNPPLSDADLKLRLPKNAKRVYPQK